jgi:hypothetical protein
MAMMLVLVALCMKALVPTGYMVGQGTKTLSIEFCSDGLTPTAAKQIVIPMKDDADRSSGEHDAAKGDCAFSALCRWHRLAVPSPTFFPDALVFIQATGFAPQPAPARQSSFDLRPPLRGPPAVHLTI